MSWTNDRVDTLKKLWNGGESASAIAHRLGKVTRNAVIGKVHRLGLGGRANQSRKRTAARPRALFPPPAPSRKSRPQPCARQDCQPRKNAAPKRPPVLPELGPPPDRLITVQTLSELTCRWPIGDPKMAGFHFCGRAKREGRPYCGHHAAIAFR
ncbi:MAG: GcrA family cell cycle regulator [Rhodomicrobium sp.]